MFYLYAARAARGLGDGFAAIILPTYLSELGFSLFQIRIVATAALLGSALLTLAIGLLAPYYDLRTLLLGCAALMFATGAAFPNAPSGLAVCSARASCSPEETHAAWGHVGSDQRRKRALLIIVIAIAPAARTDFLALGRMIVLAYPALDCGHRFQFLRRVVPSAFDRCAFIKIKLLGVIGPDQVFPGE